MVEGDDGLFDRLREGLRDDLGRLGARLGALVPGRGGVSLRHRRFDADGGRTRLHLRTHPDGTGLLIVNGGDTLHLAPLQAECAALVFENRPRERALVHLRTRYAGARDFALEAEYERVRVAVEKLSRPSDRCRVCEAGIPQPEPLTIRAQAPMKADLALSYACNNDCAHCYNEPGRREMPSLRTGEWRAVLDRLWEIGVPYVIFTGGEATLREDLPALIGHAESLGMICGLNSNGRRLGDPALVDALVGAGLDHVQITLASHREALHNRIVAADAFEETVAGIRNCVERGLHTITNTTLIAENAGEALQILDFLQGLGLRTFAMNGMIHSGCGAANPSALTIPRLREVLAAVRDRAAEREMRFIWYTVTRHCELSPGAMGVGLRFCNAAEYSVCVEPSGDVLPCQSYYEPAGNILRDRWEDIWDSALFTRIRFRRERPDESDLPDQCHDCRDLRLCGGGCPLERAVNNEVMSLCQTARAT
ncbi:MAG: radical SAM protein [Armatimonadota bacterium]